MGKRWTLVWWVIPMFSPLGSKTTLHPTQINPTDNNPSGLKILNRHMYREPEWSKANDIVYEIPYALIMKIIRNHEEVDKGRKMAVKRKNQPAGQEVLQDVVHKRQKMMDALTKLASG
jgi:hypothetical protein